MPGYCRLFLIEKSENAGLTALQRPFSSAQTLHCFQCAADQFQLRSSKAQTQGARCLHACVLRIPEASKHHIEHTKKTSGQLFHDQ